MNETRKRSLIENHFWKSGFSFATIYAWPIYLLAWLIHAFLMKSATDQQMDEWLQDDLRALESEALKKHNIDKSDLIGEPLCITGIGLLDGATKPKNGATKAKTGKDGKYRFSPIYIIVLHPGKDQLFVFNCVFDITTGKKLNVATLEFFYKDVVSVSTSEKTGESAFELRTTGGSFYGISYPHNDFDSVARAEKTVNVIRKMLRDKKSA